MNAASADPHLDLEHLDGEVKNVDTEDKELDEKSAALGRQQHWKFVLQELEASERDIAISALYRELEDTFPSLSHNQKLEGERRVLREIAYGRLLYLLDMPDEIFIKISEHLRVLTTYDPPYVADIKNLRLVCRQLNATSSHLLLDELSVRMDELSLAHMEEVAGHCLISKGIRTIRIVLNFHIARTLEDFAEFHARKVFHRAATVSPSRPGR